MESPEKKNKSKKEENKKSKISSPKKVKKENKLDKSLLYEESLFNNVDMEYMHSRYLTGFSYYKSFKEMLQVYQDSCSNFGIKIPSINGKFINDRMTILNKEKLQQSHDNNIEYSSDSINLACNGVFSLMVNQAQIYTGLAQEIEKLLSKYPSNIKQLTYDKKEKELQSSYKNINKLYIYSKDALKKNKSEYENNFILLEKMIKDSLGNKVDQYKLNQKINNLKTISDKYKASVEEVKNKKEEKIKNEKELLDIYQSIDSDFFSKIKEIIGTFIKNLKAARRKYKEVLKNLEKQYKLIDFQFDMSYNIKRCINDNNDNKKLNVVDENFEFEPYEPKCQLPQITTINPNEKEKNIYNINFAIISKIKENFDDICPEINMKVENQKLKVLEKMQKMFYPEKNYDFSRKDKDALLSLLKSKILRKFFLILLSNQRTKGRFQYGWKLINDLGDILRFILNISQKEGDYETAKNCIIISQTFFCQRKDTKKQIYLFKYVKNHNWLRSPLFWENISDIMVTKEIENNNEVLGEEALKKESEEEKKDRISQVYLSQMYTFSENMVEFELCKDDIYKIINKSAQKFNVSDIYKTEIFNIVEQGLKKKINNGVKIEEDEIEFYIKKRQRTLVKFTKKIKINNHTFNKKKKTSGKIKINLYKSSLLLPSILKLERNKIFDNIKSEIKLSDDLKINPKNISEIISKENNNSNENYIETKKSKSSNLIEDIENQGKNEILIGEDKNSVEEIKKEEMKKEEPIKEENNNIKKEEIKEEEKDNKKEEIKEEEQENKKEEIKEEEQENKKEEIKEEIKEEEQDNKKEEIKEEKQENKKEGKKEEKQENKEEDIEEEEEEIEKEEVNEPIKIKEIKNVIQDK